MACDIHKNRVRWCKKCGAKKRKPRNRLYAGPIAGTLTEYPPYQPIPLADSLRPIFAAIRREFNIPAVIAPLVGRGERRDA